MKFWGRNSLLFSFFVIFSVFSQPKTDWARQKLKGKAKTVQITLYLATEKDGEIKKGDILYRGIYPNNTLSFVKLIKRMGSKQFFMDFFEEIVPSITVYNTEGYIVEKHFLHSSFRKKHLYKYDKNNNLLSEDVFEFDALSLRNEYKYNADNQIVEEKFDQHSGEGGITAIYDYNDFGELLTCMYYDVDGKFSAKDVYSYENKKCIRKETRSAENWLNAQASYQYDNKGFLTKIDFEMPQNFTYSSSFFYEKGKLKEEIMKVNNRPDSKITNIFDEKGRVITQLNASINSTITYSYTDDYKGNWIKLEVVENNLPTLIIERNIEYFY